MSNEWPIQDGNDPWAVSETQAEPEFKDTSVKSPPKSKKLPPRDKKAPRERKPPGQKSNAASKKPENTGGSCAEQPNELVGTGNEETGDGWGAPTPDHIYPLATPGGDTVKANETQDTWALPAPGEYDPWAVPESPPDTEDAAVKPPGAKKPQLDKKRAGDKKSQRDRPPREKKSYGERKSSSDNTAEAPKTPSAETPTSLTEGDDRKKTFAYNNPERVRTGGAQRDKLTEDELTERMARMREQNEKIKQRRMDVVADEDAFKKTEESERIKQEKIRKEQESVNRTREQNARRKMDKIQSREWDSGKSTGDWKQERKKAQEESGGPSQGVGSSRGRGDGWGGPSGRRRGSGWGDGEADSAPMAKTEDVTPLPDPEASAVTQGI